jgi:1-acyl-sn-glycerol-3-phosphate acyltransferase
VVWIHINRFIIAKCFRVAAVSEALDVIANTEESSTDSEFEKVGRPDCDVDSIPSDLDPSNIWDQAIFNATWDSASPSASGFTWSDVAFTVTQTGAVLGNFCRTTAYLGLLVSTRILPSLSLSIQQFESLHLWLSTKPVRLCIKVFDAVGIESKGIRRLASVLDLPVLFFFFMNNSFYFSSALVAPEKLDGSRYAVNCVAASHRFIQRRPASATDDGDLSCLKIGGSSCMRVCGGVWWGLSQPKGSFLVRLSGVVLASLFRAIFSEVTMDLASFFRAFESAKQEGDDLIIIVPTHRSLLDPFVLGFSLFTFPECGFAMPSIAAADDFERIPWAGSMIRSLGGFFVRRGRGRLDDSVAVEVEKHLSGEIPMELFMEGKRSRDRRFLPPKTGLLRCISRIKPNVTLVPVVISYERIPEQELFTREECGLPPHSLGLRGLFRWISVRTQFTQRH